MNGKLAFLLVAILAPAPLLADERDDQARQVVEEFVKALQAKNLEATVRLVDVPWFHDGQRVIASRDELKPIFEKLLGQRDFAGISLVTKRVMAYDVVRPRLDPAERELIDGVLAEEDRVVLLGVTKGGKPQESVVILVRFRGGKPAIVGIRE